MLLQALFCAWQFSQVAPPRPHAVKVFPPRHAPLSQHPLQFGHAGIPPAVPPLVPPPVVLPPPAPPPVLPPTHNPAVHACPCMQIAQERPSTPHAPLVVPPWQSWFSSQQPLQFERRHRFVGGAHDGTDAKTSPNVNPSRNARTFMRTTG